MRASTETRTSSIDDRTTALRGAGVAMLAGAVITGVFNALHPLPASTPQGTLQGILDAGVAFWKLDHLMLAVGFWLMAAGFWGLRRTRRQGPGAALVEWGTAGLLMATAGWTVHAALDGFARADLAVAWAEADAAAKPTALAIALAMQHTVDATFPMLAVFHWGSLALVGLGLARGGGHPRWMGSGLFAISAVLVGLGTYAIFLGFPPVWDLLFAAFATLTVLWALATGAWMTRRAKGAGA